MHLIDREGEYPDGCTLSLPSIGKVSIGSLPDGLDLELLRQDLRQFFGDRFVIVDSTPIQDAIALTEEAINQIEEVIQQIDRVVSTQPKRRRKSGIQAANKPRN